MYFYTRFRIHLPPPNRYLKKYRFFFVLSRILHVWRRIRDHFYTPVFAWPLFWPLRGWKQVIHFGPKGIKKHRIYTKRYSDLNIEALNILLHSVRTLFFHARACMCISTQSKGGCGMTEIFLNRLDVIPGSQTVDSVGIPQPLHFLWQFTVQEKTAKKAHASWQFVRRRI